MKVIGKRLTAKDSPAVSAARALRLIQAAGELTTVPRSRGFVFKARTHAAYEAWKASQSNPRLW